MRLRALVLLLSLLPACEARPADDPGARARAAWTLYLERPDKDTYENFIRANRAAADVHGMPHDAVGVEYQVRALEVMAAESVRTQDPNLADDVVARVDEIEAKDLAGTYEEVSPGCRERLRAARAKAAPVAK